jgi:acylphosphatase
MIARRMLVAGKVQGVFFRASTKSKADELGIKGLVRNEPDGSVYIEAEGEADNINQFIAWCKEGPPRAVVQHIDVRETDVTGFSEFTVQR